MEVNFFGVVLHEFSIGFSDLILTVASLYFLYRTYNNNEAKLIFSGLASSSFFGALFHFFFPAKVQTSLGYIVWSLVAISIGVVIIGMMNLFVKNFTKNNKTVDLISRLYFATFLVVFFFISYSFPVIILFYFPVIALLLGLSIFNIYNSNTSYKYLFFGLILSIVAALVQVSRIQFSFLDFNTLYHVIQLIGLYFIYRFFV